MQALHEPRHFCDWRLRVDSCPHESAVPASDCFGEVPFVMCRVSTDALSNQDIIGHHQHMLLVSISGYKPASWVSGAVDRTAFANLFRI